MAAELNFEGDGAQLFKRGSPAPVETLSRLFETMPADEPGVRLTNLPDLIPILSDTGPAGSVAHSLLQAACWPVRAILFDKTAGANWGLGWHQDRTIAVRERIDQPGFGPWTIKQGILHVAPPFEVLAGMVTLRLHLDDVPSTNAPLLIAPGSHRAGRVPVEQIDSVVASCGVAECLASAGDIWAYSTPILHASAAASLPKRRRVLQVDYAAAELPGGLRWLGI